MTHTVFRRARERGTASVEGVIVLPVFVVLFVGVFFVRDLLSAKLATDEEARRCAWQYSANACEAVPTGCEDVLKGVHRGNITPNLDTTIGQLEKGFSTNSDATTAVKKIIENVVVDAIAKAFTRSLDANKTIEQGRPGLFGGGNSIVSGKYRLACNIPKQEGDNIAKAAWKQFRP
jgi:hypothetical protein